MNLRATQIDETTPSGTPVILVDDCGVPHFTATRSEPWRLGNGALVVLVQGRAGGYDAKRIFLAHAPAKTSVDCEVIGGGSVRTVEAEKRVWEVLLGHDLSPRETGTVLASILATFAVLVARKRGDGLRSADIIHAVVSLARRVALTVRVEPRTPEAGA